MKDSLTPRLLAAASFVREKSVLADIGTDHAYLPIYLVEKGVSVRALAADINEGPISKAKENISEACLSEKIDTLCTDGLYGIEPYVPTDIAICGMGGELICKILERSDYVKNTNIRLILQPMTASSELYIWLCGSGFKVTYEKYVKEGARIYRVMCAEYTGNKVQADLVRAIVGTGEMTGDHLEYINSKLAVIDRRIAGIKVSGKDVSALEFMRDEINRYLTQGE